MLRRAFQVCTSYSHAVFCTSTAVGGTGGVVAVEDPLKAFVELLSSESEITQAERTISPFANVSSVESLKNLAGRSTQQFSLSDYLSLLKAALSLFKDKKYARDFIKSCGKEPSDADVAKMAVDDDLIDFLTVLLELDFKEEQIFHTFEKRFLDGIGEGTFKNFFTYSLQAVTEDAEFSISSVAAFVIASNRVGYIFPEEVKSILHEVLTSQIRNVDSANILIAILSHWDLKDKEVSQCAAKKTAQLLGTDLSCCALTIGEMCSLMNKFAERGIRDMKLLPLLSARITDHQATLSVRQLVSLAASCAKLSYFDARVQRRLAKDLLVDVNSINNWADISSLVDSFNRLRFGDMMAWNVLARWVDNHVDDAPLELLSIVISGMARSGVKECSQAAFALSKRVRPELATSQNVWLSTVYSLAFFRALSPALVESVLNKDFVIQLLQSSTSMGDRLFKTLKLMQINACAEIDLEMYHGPKLELSDLISFIKFDDETTRLARLIKYGRKELDSCNRFLSDVVFKMGSPSTHISPPCIDKVGVLFDAQIVCEEGSTRLVPISRWGESVPRPILFFGWGQTRQVSTDSVPSEKNALLGWDQLALRLLRAKGMKPVVVLHSELSALSSTVEKLQFLKKRIIDPV